MIEVEFAASESITIFFCFIIKIFFLPAILHQSRLTVRVQLILIESIYSRVYCKKKTYKIKLSEKIKILVYSSFQCCIIWKTCLFLNEKRAGVLSCYNTKFQPASKGRPVSSTAGPPPRAACRSCLSNGGRARSAEVAVRAPGNCCAGVPSWLELE